MKIQYDKKTDSAYIEFAKGSYRKSRKISDAIIVDENKAGKVLGIEILDASVNIPAFDPGKINISVSS